MKNITIAVIVALLGSAVHAAPVAANSVAQSGVEKRQVAYAQRSSYDEDDTAIEKRQVAYAQRGAYDEDDTAPEKRQAAYAQRGAYDEDDTAIEKH